MRLNILHKGVRRRSVLLNMLSRDISTHTLTLEILLIKFGKGCCMFCLVYVYPDHVFNEINSDCLYLGARDLYKKIVQTFTEN